MLAYSAMWLWGLLVLGGKKAALIQCSEQGDSNASLRGSLENKTAPGHWQMLPSPMSHRDLGGLEEELPSEP